MQRTILRYAPDYWDTNAETLSSQLYVINQFSEEYRQIDYEVKRATRDTNLNITSIKRVQNIHDMGQLVLREQLLAVSDLLQSYYRVRRFFTIHRNYLPAVLKYNIDPRRYGMSSLQFKKYIYCGSEEIILVVQVVTADHNADLIEPRNSSDYFIDYIVDIHK
ncbi:hypothetical protein NQ314_013594 [Rhamnusium bicolor]|uniref:Uncharacterized protein n=1 Tax=Rhamnusium bicolor TaxID=1586634 RepID=A0AAV8X5D3_9CUCU|nr:hypothetical protein NQ314_013594 [Rhamnusium bicolor]